MNKFRTDILKIKNFKGGCLWIAFQKILRAAPAHIRHVQEGENAVNVLPIIGVKARFQDAFLLKRGKLLGIDRLGIL
jgi:hypothetical protein